MRLVDDYGTVLKRAWSVRFMIAAFAFTTLETALPLLDGFINVHPGLFAAVSGLCTGAAFISRLLAQSSMGDDK